MNFNNVIRHYTNIAIVCKLGQGQEGQSRGHSYTAECQP